MLPLRILSLACVWVLVACFGRSSDGAPPGDAGAAGAADRDAGPRCGDGVVDPGEQCDGDAFATMTSCELATGGGLPLGQVRCGRTCALDLSLCNPDPGDGHFLRCSEDPVEICDQPSLGDVCARLIACDTVPGGGLDEARCEAEMNLPCASCIEPSLGLEADDAGVFECDAGCADACGLLALPPENTAQCLALLAPFRRPVVQDACFCESCLSDLTNCVADDACWFVVQCALRTGCADAECLTADTCQGAINQVGLGSAGVTSALSLGSCMSKCTP